jgi:hydrogenase maturation protein HypF
MALEQEARGYLFDHPGFDTPWTSMDPAPLVAELFSLSTRGHIERARGAALFHLGLARGLAHRTIEAAREHASRTVVLGGGCFFNRVLGERLTQTLKDAGLTVLRPQSVDCGDAGLALGQAWVAACSVSAGRAGSRASQED